MISAPLAIFCDWLIMNVLAAPSSRRRRLGRKSTRRSGQPSEKRKSDHITTLSADQERAGNSRQGTGGRRRFSVANFLGVGLTSRLRTTLQEDLSNLLRGLCAYRLTLISNQQKELNDLWGLKDNGHFLTDADWEEGELGLLSRPRQWLSRATGGQRDVQQAITNDLRQVRKNLDEEIQLLKGRLDSDTERGRRLLFLFQRDLLPGINGEILEAKNSRDVLPLRAVDAKLKLMALIFICILNAAMLFFVYLFAFNQTTARQGAWLQSFLVWLVMEVLLVSTVVVYFTHFLLPSFIMRDVSKIKHRLLDSIHDYNDQVQNTHKEGSTGIPLDQQQGPLHLEATGTPSSAEDSFSDIRRAESVSVSQDQNQESDEALFNAAEFLFTSYRVAKEFPLLRESQIILRFSTPWPPQSYRRVKDVSQSYRKSLSAVTRSGSMVLIFLVGGLLQFPGAIQDVFIQMIGSVLIGYVVLIHIQLYETFPPLVALPGFLILVFLHYLLYFYQGQHRVQMTKILPIQQTLEKCEPDASQDEEEIHSVQEPSQQAGEMCENEVNSDTSGHDDDVADFNTVLPLGSYSGSLKIRPAQAESGKEKYDFVSLRQSILQGKAFIREMENFNRNQALAMGASKDLKKDDYGK